MAVELKKTNMGYVSIYRSIQEHWLWTDKPFSKGQAWIDILLMVNHADNQVVLGGEIILVKRGSKITSLRQLGERWEWSRTKVSTFLKLLNKENMLAIKSDTKKTIITVENYALYQDVSKLKETQIRRSSDTKKTQKNTNNNENNENNIYTPEFENFYSRYPNPKEKRRTFSNWNRVLESNLAEELIQAAKNYKKETAGRENKFIKTSANFLGKDQIYKDFIPEATAKNECVEVKILEIERGK